MSYSAGVTETLREMYQLTEKIFVLVQSEEYERVEDLLRERQVLMEKIDHLRLQNKIIPQYNEEGKAIIKKIMQIDENCKSAMQIAKNEVGLKLNHLKLEKLASTKYQQLPDYQGYFFDKKK